VRHLTKQSGRIAAAGQAIANDFFGTVGKQTEGADSSIRRAGKKGI
jgi:hypothetical protein